MFVHCRFAQNCKIILFWNKFSDQKHNLQENGQFGQPNTKCEFG
jgi:hypothetical protein